VGQDGAVTLTVRRLEPADAVAARRLGWEAFGVPPAADLGGATVDGPGYAWFGAFDDDGTLVATAADRAYDTWFGGRTVPTCGVASVTVAAEHRGAGAIGPLVRAMLTAARERGAVLSTLFPSAPRIYRRLGYEVITSIGHVLVPSTALAAVPVGGATVRRAGAADAATLRGLYDRWAASQNGPLTRRGPSFPGADDDLVSSFTGVTLAVGADGEPTGYAAWIRGGGDDVERALEVVDLISVDVDATRALLRTLGSFSSVVGDVRLRTSGTDPVRLLLPTTAWRRVHEELYMLAVLDVEAALDGLPAPAGLVGVFGFTLAGGVLDGLDGSYRVDVADGRLGCARGSVADDRTLDPRGLALLYAGAAPCGELRALGLLRGGEPAADAVWDALFAGRRPHVRDQF
jgi:predicted acetyltransferase